MSSEASGMVSGVAVRAVGEVNSAEYDALVVVLAPGAPPPQALEDFLAAARQLDANPDRHTAVLACARVSGGRLVLAATGALTEYDDVRALGEAARAGVARALRAGSRRPALALAPHARWPLAPAAALLGALEALYVPLQERELFPARAPAAAALGVYGEGVAAADVLRRVLPLERARALARDIGGADPERMTPLATLRLVQETFAGTCVSVRAVTDTAELRARYPLLAAVDRAAASVPRHRGCVIFLEYKPAQYSRAVFLVGKGVTYDTGGCDIKAGGAMAGMSRDKCGAAAVVGFLQACAETRPALRVWAALGMVRNSVGEEAYVADELLRSRRGLAVRVGNTDAEGRMVMADLLAEARDEAEREPDAHVYTVATLTGHALRAYGEGYSAAVDNHCARARRHAHKLQAAGEALGDMLEVSTLRREDLAAHRGRGAGDGLQQADSLPSSALPRGHQAPAAFLLLAAGLDEGAVPYTHLDVAASAGSLPAQPTAAPLLALAQLYGLV